MSKERPEYCPYDPFELGPNCSACGVTEDDPCPAKHPLQVDPAERIVEMKIMQYPEPDRPCYFAVHQESDDIEEFEAEGHTEPIARRLAALKAREANGDG